MPWFYYSGNIARSIEIKPGLSQVVKPHTKIEIEKVTKAAQVLINQGSLRRTGKQKLDGKQPVRKVPNIKDMKKVLPKSDMAKAVAEKGVTTSSTLPPIKPVGKPEMTEGELLAADKEKGAAKVDELSSDEKGDGKGKRKQKKGDSKKS